jgi:quinoprotein glucose dehydrogenase
MVVDQNYLRVRKYFLLIFFLFFSSVSYSDDYSLTKITKLDEPWGSAFISNDEIIVT